MNLRPRCADSDIIVLKAMRLIQPYQQRYRHLNTTLTTKRAVGYLRISTPGQAGNEHNSLETQEGRYKEYCQRNDLLPVCHFVDVVSGRRDDRKEYRRMVDYAIEGNADVIVVQFLDRFGRNPREKFPARD